MKHLVVIACLAGVAAAQPADEPMECHPSPANMKIRAMFGPDTSIADLAIWVIGFTCKNVIISSDIAKHATRVTVIAPATMTPKQAVQLFVDSIEATGLVVVQKPDTFIIKLGPNMPKSCPDLALAPSTVPTTGPRPTPPDPVATDEELQKAIDGGIKRIDDTHYEIKSALVDQILANPMGVAKGARVVPAMKDGKPSGFKLYAIRPQSVFAKLGLTNGDTLVTINGMSLDSADKALEVYTKIRDAKSLSMQIERRGKPITIDYTIK